MESVRPVNPVAGYVGGKKQLARRIIARIAEVEHTIYAEPFVGMGGVFLRRPSRPKSEAINDASRDVAIFFRILQRHYQAFLDMLKWQVTSRAEFQRLAAQDPDTLTDLERAARFLYLQRLSFGGKVASRSFGIDTNGPARFDITRLVPLLEAVHERLAGVWVDCLPWQEFLGRWDRPGTLFYLDPPYWGTEHYYGRGLFGRDEFQQLSAALQGLQGRFILSLNDVPEVRELFSWAQIETVELSYQAGGADNSKRVREVVISIRGDTVKLLNDIIDGAASTEVSLPVLLRKSLVLASRLKNGTLKEWCSAELDGYSPESSLPSYRVFDCHSVGFLIAADGSTMDRQPLPLGVMTAEHQKIIREVRISAGVAELEALIADPVSNMITSPWSPNLTLLYQQKFYRHWVLNRAWREFPAARFTGICDTVRNKLLRLALELSEEIGESDQPLQQMTPAQVEATVNNYIYGGQNVISSSVGRDLSLVSNSGVVKGDFSSLSDELQKLGIQPKDIEALPAAISADTETVGKGDIGQNVEGWIGRAAKGALKGANSVATSTVAAAIKHYLGI